MNCTRTRDGWRQIKLNTTWSRLFEFVKESEMKFCTRPAPSLRCTGTKPRRLDAALDNASNATPDATSDAARLGHHRL